ncbi:MAG: ABC transporter ATP-binding protein [Limnochordales bacterium]|nr:ABC transporter ATP-binding protein [Limnochordales bacterium]
MGPLPEPLLAAHEVHAGIGPSKILHGLSLAVGRGEVVALLGRNGAGKTTALRTLMGHIRPRSGAVLWRGQDITRWPPHARARTGIAYVPQDRRMFPGLTVEENLEVAEAAHPGGRPRAELYELFPVLAQRRRQLAGFLSGGEQRMLALARALVANPALILLDEPTDGLAPVVVEQLLERIAAVAAAGISILLAEQNVRFAALLAGRGYLIHKGAIRREGSVQELLADEEAAGRYLAV